MPPAPLPEPPADFARWPFWKRWFGQRSERFAARYLRARGYRVLAANVADRRGELDLLALDPDGKTLVVVEVRSTSGTDPATAAATVDRRKQRKVSDAAARFVTRRRLFGVNVRFDVLAIAWPPAAREPVVAHLPGAFDAVGRFQMWS